MVCDVANGDVYAILHQNDDALADTSGRFDYLLVQTGCAGSECNDV